MQSPYNSTPWLLPARIEAEFYDNGNEDESYLDNSNENRGGELRTDQVDIYTTIDGSGYKVGHIETGEWLEYTINVPTTGYYNIAIRASNQWNGRSLKIELNGVTLWEPHLTQTWDSETFETELLEKVQLIAGTNQVLRVTAIAGGTDMGLNWIEITEWVNRAPTANAGFDRTLAWPNDSVTLTATAEDEDPSGSVQSTQWTKISGPSATLSGASTKTLNVTNLQQGVYEFEFSATDDIGDISTDRVEVAVLDEAHYLLVPPSDPRIQYVGRFKDLGTDTPEVGWSGASINVEFSGTSIAAKMSEGVWPESKQRFYAIIDGDDTDPKIISLGENGEIHHIASGLSNGSHTLQLISIDGAWVAPTEFKGFLLGAGTSIENPSSRPDRRIEFFGDSITEGGLKPDQSFTDT
ncbi:MAG: carbohydrate-binding protein, partial [Verrucomicrobiota bacterium]